jgi:hypothetical protein
MKNIILSITIVACCLLSTITLCGCSNTDNAVQTEILQKEKLIGKWTIYYVEEGYDQTLVGTQWWYDANGVFTNVQGDEQGVGTYEWEDDRLVMTIDNKPWGALVKQITDKEMTWYGRITGKTIKLKRL